MPDRAPNATASSDNPEGLVGATVFPNQGRGYGYGVTKLGFDGSLPEGYDRTINMTVKDGRVISPSFAATTNYRFASRYAPAFVTGWQDTASIPIALIGVNTQVYQFKNNSIAVESMGAIPAARLFSASFHDDGSSGNAYFYAGADPTAGYLRRRTQAGVWTEASGAGQLVRAKYITSSAGKLWGTINDFQIRHCPAGSEPFTLINWAPSVWVGTSEAKITSIGHIANIVIVGKENGIWAYNEADNRYEPIYRERFHPDNFPFMNSDGQGGLFTATAEGKVVHIQQFGNVAAATTLKDKFIGRDTPRGRITDMAVFGDKVYALADRGGRSVQPPGMKVLITTDAGTTYTDYTAAAIDQQFDVPIDISGFNSNSWILVGDDQPFCAVDWVVQTANTLSNTLAVAVASSAGAFSSFTLPFWLDSSDTAPSTSTPWGQSGTLAIRPNSYINIVGTLAGTTYWQPGAINGMTKYWMRVKVV